MAERGLPNSWQHLAQWSDGEIDLDTTLSTLPCSDRDAAELVASLWPGWVSHDPGKPGSRSSRWYLWDGRHHAPDRSRETDRWLSAYTHLSDVCFQRCHQQLEVETARRMAGQPQQAIDAQVEADWKTWTDSKAWAYARALRMTTGLARLREGLAGLRGVDTDSWPANPTMINAADWVVSLDPAADGFEYRPHDPALLMTYVLDVPWWQVPDGAYPLAMCPQFDRLVRHATGWDEQVFWYLIHALGYALLGDNRYQLIFFLSGPTASGKSTLLEIVSTVLGDLAHEAKPDLITKSDRGRHGRHESSIRGKRLVTIGETNDQLKLDENQIKALTGGKRLSVDVIYKEELTGTLISALLFIANNQMPRVDHLDEALQRRAMVIPMGATIPPEERDEAMVTRIVAQEAAGIFAALVWACRRVVASHGVLLTRPPAAVLAKTEAYRAEQDTVARWLLERTWQANGTSPQVAGKDALADYASFCVKLDGGPGLTRPNFYEALEKQSGVQRTGDVNHTYFRGFVLRDPPL